MTRRKKIKIGLLSIGTVAFLLFAVLIVHIAFMVHGQESLPMSNIQMARADFQAPVDSLQALLIQKEIRHVKGVKSSYFNIKEGIVVYTYDNRQNNMQDIYDEAIKIFHIPSVRYIVSEKDLASGCPVIKSNSFYGKLTILVSKFVN